MPETPSASDHLQTALEAGCDALITLQALDARLTGDGGSTPPATLDEASSRVQLTQAIEALRAAISELRLARDQDLSALGLGFVMGTGEAGSGDYTSPRRTA